MTTSRPHATVRPIIQQHQKPSSCSSEEDDDIVDSSRDPSYERLPPLTLTTSHPQPQAASNSTSTLASTASVNTYDSRLSKDYVLDPSSPCDNSDNDDLSEDSENDQLVQLLPDDAAIPSALPIYRLPPINDYPIRPTSPVFFSELFPTLDRLTIRHDDLTPDGNMNLRIETPPHFLLPPEGSSSSCSARRLPPPTKRPVAFQLFHLRMHDLARREFSLRRYCRDSGREICSSKRAFALEGQVQPQVEDEDEDDNDDNETLQRQTRPGTSGGSIQRSVSSAFRSVANPFQRSSPNNSSLFRRPGSISNSHRRSSSRSTCGSSWDAGSASGAVFSTDKLSMAPSTSPSSRYSTGTSAKAKPVKQATDTIKLEFSNYARVDLTRSHGVGPQGVVLYVFEWWGHAYSWRRVVDENTETVSYHLIRDGRGRPIAHIVPETRGLEEVRADEKVGGWVPPCHIWISDKSVLNAMTDVADVIMATGLITLVDDSIRTRWQLPQHLSRPPQPAKSYTGDGLTPRPKGLLNSIFQRRRSEQCTSRSAMKRGRPVAVY